MAVHGIVYLGFLLLAVAMARATPTSAPLRQLWMLAASYLFYWSWNPWFLLLLAGSSLANFGWCRLLRRSDSGALLAVGVAGNLALLLFGRSGLGAVEIVGVSFYTFEAIGAQIDTWRGYRDRPTLREFCLFMAFWPTMLAGPICRLPQMLPQFRALAQPAGSDLREGARRIVIGLFQKIVIAETLFRGIGPDGGVGIILTGTAASGGWLESAAAAVGIGLYIYFDFSGYSNIAIGGGRLFGLQLPENFDRPLLAVSPADFWSRWHMSLSSWIRDYVFFPLATLGRSRAVSYGALMVAMVAFGLWHGLQLHFFLWGLYQGALLAGHRLAAGAWRRLPAPVAAVLTFSLISAGWPLFAGVSASLWPGGAGPEAPDSLPALVGGLLAVYLAYEAVRWWLRRMASTSPWPERLRLAAPACYATMALWVIVWSEQSSPFVYVRF